MDTSVAVKQHEFVTLVRDVDTRQTKQDSIPQTNKPILLVEDNPANQRLALRQLERLGYTVHPVANGLEAIEAAVCAADTYALILMDCRTPGLDGFAATRIIRQVERISQRRIPIIAMTANAMQGDRDACIAAGMDDYMSKPVRLDTLREILDRWLSLQSNETVPAAADLPGNDPEIDLLDDSVLAALRELEVAGEPHFLSDLIDIYFNDTPKLIDAMRAAIAQGHTSRLHHTAHTLKGSSSSIGARSVAKLCTELEELGRAGTIAGACEWLLKVEAEYERVKPALEAERHSARAHGELA